MHTDFWQPALLQALSLSEGPRSTDYLAELTGLDQRSVEEILHIMHNQGDVVRQPSGGWELATDAAAVDNARELLRERGAPDSLERHLGFLDERVWTDHVDRLLQFLDARLNTGSRPVIICLELTAQFFFRLGTRLIAKPDPAQNKKFIESVLFVQMLCLSTKQHAEISARLSRLQYEVGRGFKADGFPSYKDLIKKFTDFSLSEGSISSELGLSLDSLKAVAGETGRPADFSALFQNNPSFSFFRQLYDVLEQGSGKAEERLFNLLATGLSHIAMHRRYFSISEHLSSSLSAMTETGLIDEDGSPISLIWLSHYCFVLLRQGKLDEALEHLTLLFNCLDTKDDPLSFASAARGVAVYHFFNGRPRHAHTVLTRETQFAIERGIPHAAFLDPMNFDMLYVFEQLGYPPVPRYELDATIEDALAQSGQLMQGAALRVKALRLRARGESPHTVIGLLRASEGKLHPERDLRERILTLHELANTLNIVGEYDESRRVRKIIAAHAGRTIDPDTPYVRLAYLATLIPNAEQGPADAQPEFSGPRQEGEPRYDLLNSITACLHKALTEISLSAGLEDIINQALASLCATLRCERAELVRQTETGSLESFTAAFSSGSQTNRAVPDWLTENTLPLWQPGLSSGLRGTVFSLTLGSGENSPWVMTLDFGETGAALGALSLAELAFVGRWLEVELSALLRVKRQCELELIRYRQMTFPAGPAEREQVAVFGQGMLEVLKLAESAAGSTAQVLLQGETGVGKELVARHIHACSGRKGGFVAIHPASTSETLFESEFFGHERGAFTGAAYSRKGFFAEADQGTLFIDEVGDIPPLIQTKLLRVLQEQSFMRVGSNKLLSSDFRLVTATNKDLRLAVEQGAFRADLLFRIAVIPIVIPPLRERRQDIPLLTEAYLTHFCRLYDRRSVVLSPEHLTLLHDYAWPGNVRELKNTMERIVIQGRFEPEFLLYAGKTEAPPKPVALYEGFPSLDELEKRYLRHVLDSAKGRVRGPGGAASLLGVKTSTLYAKMKRLGLS